ncbi:MAG: phosphomethylpyrimidine kinase [Methanomicrobiales archaeon]|nr:phosphomethylpyrimidine kinase [Methanomicrobiales archaeon]MDD1660056.1 phosphomethylpyrimidine kinase [Methanomicrobiales archaeon]
MGPEEERKDVLKRLEDAVARLREGMVPSLIPEVGTNLAYAVTGARSPADVAAVEGRIVRLKGQVHPVGTVAFGASDHMARVVLTAMRFDPRVRAAGNIRFSEEAVARLEGMLLEVCEFDRGREPPGVSTMDWGVASCCREGVPDVIVDRGAVGKEPMIRILGEDPETVVKRIIQLSQRLEERS